MRQVEKVGKFFVKIEKYSELCESAVVRKTANKRRIARRHAKVGMNYASRHCKRCA